MEWSGGNRAVTIGVDRLIMYRPTLNRTDRTGAIAAVAIIHVGLLFAFLHMGGTIDLVPEQGDLDIFDVSEVKPPPPVIEEPAEKMEEEEGEASPQNIKSKATPVVQPKPRIQLPPPPPVTASPTPNQGAAPTQGAAPVPGPGTGAGGSGTGTGAGGSGSGSGGGGGGGVAVGASLVRGISGRDYPPAIQRSWPRGGRIFLRLRIEPDGRPSRCDVMRSFGDRAADQWSCSLVMNRAVFRPARNADGEPVAAWFGYVQEEVRR